MRASYFIRAAVLLIALVGVIYAIRTLQPSSVQKAMLALGVEPGTQASPGLQPASRALQEGEQHLNICRTRIHAIEFDGGQKVEEFKQGLNLKWLAFEDSKPRELGYLDVEKWLSRHCQIIVKPVDEAALPKDAVRGKVKLVYIDRTELPIDWIYGHHFQFEGKTYDSTDFADALAELRGLASFEKPGGP